MGKSDEFAAGMSHFLHIIGDMILPAFGLGFVIWLFWFSFKRSPDRPRLAIKWGLTGLIVWYVIKKIVPDFKEGAPGTLGGPDTINGLFYMCVIGVILYAIWRHSVIDLIANPIGSLFDGGNVEVEPRPYYSIALSKRKLNHPLEAIVVIRQQLAKFPNDYEGTILLATIQAEDLKDMPSAEITLNHFIEWDKAPDKQIVAALNQIADWHMEINKDVDSARDTLQRIIEKFPDTPSSNAAAQRIAHLGGTEKILLSAINRRRIAVPVGLQSAGLQDSISHIVPAGVDPDTATADLVKHLEQHPLDTEARERLAILYARHHHRLDLATHELLQLAEQPGQPSKKVAHWLNLLADLQIHGGADYEMVRPVLEKIVELFPDLPVADLARRRLGILRLEIKGKEKAPPDKVLGEYEQNIGLKGNRFYSPREL
jgi:tetratricopeptide (TPR) repeat protein